MPKLYPKTCAFCGTSYVALRSTGKFCHRLCQTRHELAAYKAKYGVTRVALAKRRNKKLGLCSCGQNKSIGFQSCAKCLEARAARWQTYSSEERARRGKRKHGQSRKGKIYSKEELAKVHYENENGIDLTRNERASRQRNGHGHILNGAP